MFSRFNDEFDLWFQQRLAGATGLDMSRPVGPMPGLLSGCMTMSRLRCWPQPS